MPSADAFISGAIAGSMTDCILHPLDTIKTRLQTGKQKGSLFTGLFSGLAPALAGSAPSGALFFGTYSLINENFMKIEDQKSISQIVARSWVCCSAGEAAACVVRAPVDILKQNAQIGMSVSESLLQKQMTVSHVRQVYVALLVRELPFAGIQLPLLEVFRSMILSRWDEKNNNNNANNNNNQQNDAKTGKTSQNRVYATMISGFFGGGAAAFLTTPIDVVKTRIAVMKQQQQQTNSAEINNTNKKPSVAKVFRDIFRKEGIKSLFAGASPRVTMISCGGTIFFGSFEFSRLVLQK